MDTQYRLIGNRNPIIEFYNIKDPSITLYRIQTIGDPHLDRKFLTGVPKTRLGHREQLVYQEFEKLLNQNDYIDLYVVMGDLFNKAVISNECLNRTINIVKNACLRNKKSFYYILNGNHDVTRDQSRVSSFSLLKKYFNESLKLNNLTLVDSYISPVSISKVDTVIYFSYFNPFESTENIHPELIKIINGSKTKLKIAFGHFDVIEFNEDQPKYTSSLIPKYFYENFNVVVTGHIHKPENMTLDHLDIIITGSLQPFAFGEEIKDDNGLYQTLSLDRCNELISQNKDYFKDSNVRLLYKNSDQFIDNLNCLSLIYKLIDETPINNTPTIINTESISFKDLVLDAIVSFKELDATFIDDIEQSFLSKTYE